MIKDLLRLFYKPRLAISEISRKSSIKAAVSIVFCMFMLYVSSHLLFVSKAIGWEWLPRSIIPWIVKFFIQLCAMWMVGCGLIHLYSRCMNSSGKREYLKLLSVTGYLSVIGIPFTTFSESGFIGEAYEGAYLSINAGLTGIISPLLFYLLGLFFGGAGNLSIISIFLLINRLFFAWSFVLIVLSVGSIYITSILKSLWGVSAGLLLYSLLFIAVSSYVNLSNTMFYLMRIGWPV